jgi:hypothetical protein
MRRHPLLSTLCASTGMRWARLTKTDKIGTARFKENYFYRLKQFGFILTAFFFVANEMQIGLLSI